MYYLHTSMHRTALKCGNNGKTSSIEGGFMFTVEYAKCTAHAHTQQSDCTVTQVWASAATCCWIQLNAVTLVKPIRRTREMSPHRLQIKTAMLTVKQLYLCGLQRLFKEPAYTANRALFNE